MYTRVSRKRKAAEQVVPGIGDAHDERRSSHDSVRGGAPPAPTASPYDDADYPIPDFESVYRRMRHAADGLDIADRRYRLILYPRCFVGSQAVQWMVDNLSIDRAAAVKLGQRLLEAGIVQHVTHSEPFSDDYFFYRFQEDDITNILNMKRVWSSAIPTRHAVDVAESLLTRLALLCEEHRKRILALKNTPEPPALTRPQSAPPPSAGPPTVSTPNLAQQALAAAAPIFASPSLPSFLPNIPSHLAAAASPLLSMSPRLATTAPAPPASPPCTPLLTGPVGDDIDYSTLAKSEHFRQYTLAAAELQRVQLVALDHDERIAFFANVYNALCLHAHVVHGPPNSIMRRWEFFRCLSYRIAGLDMTLDDIEHGILRGNKRAPMIRFMQQLRPTDPKCQHVLTKRDGRIHFVISAGTKSDPHIRILDGDNVQEELHNATAEFLIHSVKVDVERRTVSLPRIFYWYADDFPTPEKNLLVWVATYLSAEMGDRLIALSKDEQNPPVVTYENFDWSNPEAQFSAPVVRRKRRKLEKEASSGTLPSIIMPKGLDMTLQTPTGGLSEPFPGFPIQPAPMSFPTNDPMCTYDVNTSPLAISSHPSGPPTQKSGMMFALPKDATLFVQQQQAPSDKEPSPSKSDEPPQSVVAQHSAPVSNSGNGAHIA